MKSFTIVNQIARNLLNQILAGDDIEFLIWAFVLHWVKPWTPCLISNLDLDLLVCEAHLIMLCHSCFFVFLLVSSTLMLRFFFWCSVFRIEIP
jgi:hypothetical protein